MKILKIQIHVAQNVGKVWISRKNTFPAIQAIFSMERKNHKHGKRLPIFLGGPMGPIRLVWGHVLVS